jgi:uncharacterized coiled-coil protein SlyX
MNPLIQVQKITPVFLVALLCFGPLPTIQAVSPPPDGCYPNYTTADGCKALNSLTSGAGNTALGWYSLYVNTSGNFNTGVGGGALALNNGDSNTAVGAAALLINNTGMNNVAIGSAALQNNTSGSNNIGLGVSAGDNITGDNNIDIGNNGVAGDSGVIRIGDVQSRTYIAGIAGREANCDSPLIGVDPDGRLGIPRCMSGAPLSFNDLRQEHKKVEEQQATIIELKSIVAQQQKAMEMLTAQLKEQAAQIQKVSAQIETSKPAPHVVENNR